MNITTLNKKNWLQKIADYQCYKKKKKEYVWKDFLKHIEIIV